MFEQASKRLFLVFLPLFFIALAFFLVSIESKKQKSLPVKAPSEDCPILLGVSPFPKENQDSLSTVEFPAKLSGESYFLTKKQLLKSIKSVESLSPKKTFFVWPLVLNKEEDWIISEKVFFILPSKERKEISHLNYEEILNFQKSGSETLLNLDTALLYTPKNSQFLFRLLGSDRKKIIKNLDKALSKVKGELYISSDNERLLTELKTHSFPSNFKILHSYKSVIRLEMLSILPSSSFPYKNFTGDGLLIPEIFSTINLSAITLFKQKGKLIFFEKEPPYTKEDRLRIQKASALISSQAQKTLEYLKTNCF